MLQRLKSHFKKRKKRGIVLKGSVFPYKSIGIKPPSRSKSNADLKEV